MRQATARLAFAAVLGSGLLLAACVGPKQETKVEVAPTTKLEPMKSALVVGAFGNPTARQSYETEMVARLQKEGVKAERSIDVVGADLPKRADVERAATERGYDSVVVARFAGTRAETGERGAHEPYLPSYTEYYVAEQDPYQGGTTQAQVGEYVMVDTLVFQKEAGAEQPVFVARTETERPRDAKEVVKGTIKGSTPELKKSGLL